MMDIAFVKMPDGTFVLHERVPRPLPGGGHQFYWAPVPEIEYAMAYPPTVEEPKDEDPKLL